MLKFVLGIIFGAALAFGYVRWDVAPPGLVDLPAKLRGNIISSATENDLYSLNRDQATRQRALEIFFANRALFAVKVDAEFGHPFLKALYRRRAAREARQLRMQWTVFDAVLAKPTLRARLEKKHGTGSQITLKQQMLAAALERHPFLKNWMARNIGSVSKDNLLDALVQISPYPQAGTIPKG